MNEEIARRLREAAEAHQPDRARMLARVQRGMAGPAVRHRVRPLKRSGPRFALGAVVTAGLLATGGLAVAGIVHTLPTSGPVTAPATPSPSPSAAPVTPSPAGTTAGAVPVAPPSSARPSASATAQAQNGPLWSAGSVSPHSTVYWAESDLVLRTGAPLTALTVELRIAQTGNVQSTGDWQTLSGNDFTVTVQDSGGSLVYRWVLKPGRTVPAGQHEFAAQYNHATGTRSAAGDGYRVDAQGPGGPAAVGGGFVPGR
ncbi:hypothetical protein C7C46_00360 [Streptomyces tateyamensis]|uniref:Uncharacterized protein n=1 Tax=Streptomyces tateyamensis TaxID=565073 RepID=A0A2V4NPI0_9ACTN|nr:hypothetical protein [Streptomyces tateyamensis]PYC88369.1 hypothetical protein C7C46_00360 [Streptomyces tateyamensis]